MGKKVKVSCTRIAYYDGHIRAEGSIILFDMDHCGTKMVDGKEVKVTVLPTWAKLVDSGTEEREGGEEIEQPKETTLNELTTKAGPQLSKPSAQKKQQKKGK